MADRIIVVFMGTPDFAVPTLKALIEDQDFSIEAVVTQQDKPKGRGKKLTSPPVKTTALEAGLRVLQPKKARDPECVEAISAIGPDYIVVVAYGQILPVSILEAPGIAPVNLHASLLPRWRGAAPIHRAFLAGDKTTGVCSMLMAEGLDTGDVLLCEKTEITGDDTVGRLHDRLAEIGAKLMVRTLKDYKIGKIAPIRQDDSKATYAEKLSHNDFLIDWSRPAGEVSRRIRGLSPYPGAIASLNGRKLKILFARALDEISNAGPGGIISISRDGIKVACGEGSVLITELKPEGKGAMTAHAYTLGSRLEPGDRFD